MDEIYRVEELRLRVLNLLRKEGPMKAGDICMKLTLPYWAVSSALDSAMFAGLVSYDPARGFVVVGATT